MDILVKILFTITYIPTVIWSFSTYGFVLGIVVSLTAAPVISIMATVLIIGAFALLFLIIGFLMLLINPDQKRLS